MEDAGVATTSGSCHDHPTVETMIEGGSHDVPYAGIEADGSSLDLPSAGVEDEGGNLDSTNGEGDEIANSTKSSGSKDLKLKSDKEEDLKLKLKLKLKEEKNNRNCLLLLTMLLVMAMPAVVWRSINQPELVLWRLSLLLCCCCVIWSLVLDVGIVRTMLSIFPNSFLLALYVDAKQDTRMGALIVHLN